MNRKQKTALVLGAVVIAFLGMFPPWQVMYQARIRDYAEGAPPAEPPPVLVGPRWAFGPRMGGNADPWYSTPDFDAALSLQLGTLALTVAAVVVLKGRRV